MKRLLLISILIGLLDQAVKAWANVKIPLHSPDIELLPIMWKGEQAPLITLTHVHNEGIAFGMMQNVEAAAGFFTISSIVMSVVIVIAMGFLYKREPGICFALALQLGGAIGNVIDRIRLGYVLDFIQLPNWPVFNVADMAVTVGTVLLIYYLIRPRPAEERRAATPEMEEGVLEHVGFSLPADPRLDESIQHVGNSGGAKASLPGAPNPEPGGTD